MGGLIQHKTQEKENFFKITEQKGEVFSSESLKNNSTKASNVDSIKCVDVTEAVHAYHVDTSENKVLAPAFPVPKYKTDMLTKAAKPHTLLPLLLTKSPCFPGWQGFCRDEDHGSQ
jgi:hypothetical protein